MSRLLIQNYLAELSKLRQVGGTHRESVVREAFKDLLKGWARSHDLTFGNRCALEWILDQYKVKTPKDPTIRAKFNTYRFADYKDKVIDLIARVTRVSVETMRIVGAMMKDAPR